MKKNNHYKKEIEIKIGGEDNIDTLMKIADSPEGEELGIFNFQDANPKGVTFGRGLNRFEREGKGLPTPDDQLPQREFHFEFDVRFTLDESEDIELFIAAKDAGTHFKYMLKGLSVEQANAAVIDFERQISNAIKDAIYFHAWACYRKQDENIEKRNESYKKIMSNLETRFKGLLKWKRDKPIEVREENGIKITKYDPFPKGADPQTKAEIEKERQIFLRDVFFAFKELDKKRITTPKQKDLRPYIFKQYADAEQKISETLKKHKLKFKDLRQTYLANKDLETFLNAG